jgi:hypothetical protein
MIDFGDFIFYEEGFSTVNDKIRKFYKWNEVEEIIAYKVDLITIDLICIELFFRDYKILFNEDFKGWNELLKRMHQNFPQINQNWQFDIVKPAFARNEMIIFRSDR